MQYMYNLFFILIFTSLAHCQNLGDTPSPPPSSPTKSETRVTRSGTMGSDFLIECSGIDTSLLHDELLWAINDSGDEPFLYAMGIDGRDLGRVRIDGAINRDWEDLATFTWQGRPMILIADIGDNRARYGLYHLYIIEEPRVPADGFPPFAHRSVAWTIRFTYPDRNHDAEAISVDASSNRILILTKREKAPILFSLPLRPAASDTTLTASYIAQIDQLPQPTEDDLQYPYGKFRSQPTAMDISSDGLEMLVLTYKDAYLFKRQFSRSWDAIANLQAVTVALPLPQNTPGLIQREAACFSRDGNAVILTSEGLHAGIFKCSVR